ncbi:BnaUnng03310D [Brassica napus]|uniref:BnaUnng03310D protein n=1 Tax=Brassica napus TaxID=3708 RepID=A0A078JVQ6_BRANA|nr:BnaUnng03310D [Brassica napus]
MVRVVCFRVVVFLLVVSVAVHIMFSCVDGSGNWRGLVIYGAFCSMWHITQ